MFRRKSIRFVMFLVIGVLAFVVGIFFYNAQKESRDIYLAVKDGKPAEAMLYNIPGAEYRDGEKNKYLYTFKAHDGKTYAASTIRAYTIDIKDPSHIFMIYYAVDAGGAVKLSTEEKATINDVKYPIALSFEAAYFDNNRQPSTSGSIAIFLIAGALFGFAVYNGIWILVYKDVEAKGELTYAVFISAAASKLGSSKYMSVAYKYQKTDVEWVEAKTPYTYNGLDAEKLMLLETFKIRYKGKRSVIVENLRGLRL